jgi:hypothetical protein
LQDRGQLDLPLLAQAFQQRLSKHLPGKVNPARFTRPCPRAGNTFTNWLAEWRQGQANKPDRVRRNDTAGSDRRAGQSGGKPTSVSQSSVPSSMPARS